jgi:hypothetical protein
MRQPTASSLGSSSSRRQGEPAGGGSSLRLLLSAEGEVVRDILLDEVAKVMGGTTGGGMIGWLLVRESALWIVGSRFSSDVFSPA